MDLSIAAILAQDGITTGAIYALLALALVLVFSVTRVIFIPQGEFVSYGALTLAALQTQKFPATCYLLMAMGAACFVAELARHRAASVAIPAGGAHARRAGRQISAVSDRRLRAHAGRFHADRCR